MTCPMRKLAAQMSLLLPMSALLAPCAWASPDEVIEGFPLSKTSLQLAGIVFGLSIFARGCALLFEGKRYQWGVVVGSLGTAGLVGAGTVLYGVEQLRSVPLSLLLGVGAAYGGGGMILKKYGDGAKEMAEKAIAKEPKP